MNQAKCDDGETMTNGGGQPAPQPEQLNQILESTVVLNWKDLTKNAEALIHVEHHIGVECSIDYLRIWSSTARGYWNLVRYCSVSPVSGLGTSLQAVMRDQGRFPHPYSANTDHLVQVGPPPISSSTAGVWHNRGSASQETMATSGAPTMK